MFLSDTVPLSGIRKTRDGYLVADAKVARTGIQNYFGAELGRPDLGLLRVYRPAEEVFARDTMASVAFRPVTDDHPSKMVDAANWKDLARGSTGGEVVRDGESVRVPLVVMDAAAIAKVEGGKRELSLGYECDVVFEAGVTDTGEAYDAVQRNIRVNHLAICSSARAGPEFRIGDRKAEPNPKESPTMTERTIIVDGIGYAVSDQAAQLVTRLQTLLGDAGKALTDAQAAHVAAIAAKDAELGAAAAKLADAEARVVTDAALDALAVERGGIIAKAKALGLADAAIAGKSNAELKSAAVAAKLGDAAVAGKPAEYIGGMFDTLTANVQTKAPDNLAPVLFDAANVGDAKSKAEAARVAHAARLRDAWQSPAGQA